MILKKGIDVKQYQSHFLFAIALELPDCVRFPLLSMIKVATRDLAKSYDLILSDKPDSQDVCFVPNGRYGDVVRKLWPGALYKSETVHMDGTMLGTHNGAIHYIIGQRHGLGIGGRKDAPRVQGPH